MVFRKLFGVTKSNSYFTTKSPFVRLLCKLFGVAKSNIPSHFTIKCPFVCHFHYWGKKFDTLIIIEDREPLFWVAVARCLR